MTHAFQRRGHEITRLEAFSDAVFAFALTLLVISLDVPRTFSQLTEQLSGFLSFALSFVALVYIWHSHNTYFRRYGPGGGMVFFLNILLLFVVLFYVYPLKFMFTLLVNLVRGNLFVSLEDGTRAAMISLEELPRLYYLYGFGCFAVFGIFALLQFNAWRRRDALALTPWERHDTLTALGGFAIFAAQGLVSVLLAFVLGPQHPMIPGMVYASGAVIFPAYYTIAASRREKIVATG